MVITNGNIQSNLHPHDRKVYYTQQQVLYNQAISADDGNNMNDVPFVAPFAAAATNSMVFSSPSPTQSLLPQASISSVSSSSQDVSLSSIQQQRQLQALQALVQQQQRSAQTDTTLHNMNIRSNSSVSASATVNSNNNISSPSAYPISKWYGTSHSLHESFSPGPYDVICARGKAAFNHSGNKYFRLVVQQLSAQYSMAKTKQERSKIVSEAISAVRSNGGGFVKNINDDDSKKNRSSSTSNMITDLPGQGQGQGQEVLPCVWIEVGDMLAREKAGQHFRNSLSSMYKSSVSSKKRRRKDLTSRLVSLHQVMTTSHAVKEAMDQMRKETELKQQEQEQQKRRGDSCSSATATSQSDDDIMAIFNRQNKNMLQLIKNDEGLKERFLQAEAAASDAISSDTRSFGVNSSSSNKKKRPIIME